MPAESGSPLRVLVVDDEDYPHVKIAEELASMGGAVHIMSAHDVESAEQAIRDEYFHLAFVDLHLGGQPGVGVMRLLAALSPSCRIVLMTQYMKEYASEVLKHLNGAIKFEGVVDKVRGSSAWFLPLVSRASRTWVSRNLDLDGLDHVAAALDKKRSRINLDLERHNELGRLRQLPAVSEELRFVLTELFHSLGSSAPKWRPRIELHPMSRGLSSSVVVEATPSVKLDGLSDPVPGNRCVIKIGARPEITTEAERYERVVRYGVTLEHRVELLGLATGDALAAVVYSFAGGNSSRIVSLDELLQPETAMEAVKVVQDLFSVSARNWYAVAAPAKCLRDYFAQDGNAPLDSCLDELGDWLRSLERNPALGLRLEEGRVLLSDGLEIPIPGRQVLATRGMLTASEGSLIHGDMHGGNVLIEQQRGRVCLIDFRNAGLGPRLMDFASLHATLRLAHARALGEELGGWPKKPDSKLVAAISRFITAERRLISDVSIPEEDWWLTFAHELDAAKHPNFGVVTKEESLWTNLAYCLSMYRFRRLEWYGKMRLLVWLSASYQALRELGAVA